MGIFQQQERTRAMVVLRALSIQAGKTKMMTLPQRQKHFEERLAVAMRQFNDAIRDVHKSGLDVDISFLTMHTQRGPMVQVDLRTFRLDGAPSVLRVVE